MSLCSWCFAWCFYEFRNKCFFSNWKGCAVLYILDFEVKLGRKVALEYF